MHVDNKPTEALPSVDAGNGVLLVPTGEIRVPEAASSRIIVAIFILLLAMGLTNLYSATVGSALFYSQLKNVVIGLGAFAAIGWFVPPRVINSYAYWVYGLVIMMLCAVALFGDIRSGAQRWLELGPFSGQPSELAKIVAALATARFFYTNKQSTPYRLRDLWLLMLLVGLIFFLIFQQPDLGTAGVCVMIAVAQILFVRMERKSVILVLSLGAAVAVLGWTLVLHDYQKLRVLNLLDPEHDPTGSGYNALQSLVAIGSGKLMGKGFMQGTQTQLQFLPEHHTDFIFAVFAEEHGFWGAAAVFTLFCSLCYLGLMIARQSKDTFSGLLAVGMTFYIFIGFAVNVAMVLAMFPVVGVPLPLFSHGGTAIITVCISLGVLVSIDRDNFGKFRRAKGFSGRSKESVLGGVAPTHATMAGPNS